MRELALPRTPIDAIHDVVKSFNAVRNPLKGPAYRVQYEGRQATHAVQPKHRAIGYIIADMMFGGGLHVLCGLPAEGKVVISENPVPVEEISCRNCLRVLLAHARWRASLGENE